MTRFKVAMVAYDDEPPEWLPERFESEGIDLAVKACKTRAHLAEVAGDADMVWIFGGSPVITPENLSVLPRCGAILRTGSGTDNIPVTAATELGIVVANTPEAHNDPVSDHAIALLLDVVRKISFNDRNMRAGNLDHARGLPDMHVHGQTLGLVAAGLIGRLVAKKMSGFEMTVLCHDPYVSAESLAGLGMRAATLDEMLSESDFVSLHCPLTKETHHLIGERELRMMKPTAVLVNTSRGKVVDEDALVQALTEGWIAGAGLDVFHEEPTPTDNPLLKLENVVATPHVAGNSDETSQLQWDLSVDTAIAFSRGLWPRSYVNRGVKPRWDLS